MVQPQQLMPKLHQNTVFIAERMRRSDTRNPCEEQQAKKKSHNHSHFLTYLNVDEFLAVRVGDMHSTGDAWVEAVNCPKNLHGLFRVMQLMTG